MSEFGSWEWPHARGTSNLLLSFTAFKTVMEQLLLFVLFTCFSSEWLSNQTRTDQLFGCQCAFLFCLTECIILNLFCCCLPVHVTAVACVLHVLTFCFYIFHIPVCWTLCFSVHIVAHKCNSDCVYKFWESLAYKQQYCCTTQFYSVPSIMN